MDFGVQIFGLRQDFNRDPQGVLRQLQEAGLTFLEPRVMLQEEPQLRGAAWTPAEFARFVPMLEEAGMRLYSCHVYTLDLLGDLPGLVELAGKYSIRQYVIPCPAFSTREAYEAQAQMLMQAGKALQQAGVELLLHNGQTESAQTLEGVTVYEWLLRSCQETVGAQVDLGWLLAGGVDIPAFLRNNRAFVRSLHYKDMEQTPQGLQECAVGQGLLDIPGCSRFAFAEGWPQVVDQNGSRGDFLQDVRQASQLLHRQPTVAFPFRNFHKLVCQEGQQMLRDAGFALEYNASAQRLSRQQQLDMIRHADAIVAGTEIYDVEALTTAENCRGIIRFGVGLDNIDLSQVKQRGIALGTTANHNAVAECALSLMLAVLRNVPRNDASARSRSWTRVESRELTGKTVGLLGFGRIGRRVAELLAPFHVELLVYDPYLDAETIAGAGGEKVELLQLLQRSEIVSLHLPVTPDTRNIINAETIAQMRPGAWLINTARGALVDEQALAQALESGFLAGAGLDVFQQEPVEEGNPLLSLENVVLSPHAAALTWEANYEAGLCLARSIIRVFEGGKPENPVKL